MISVNLLSIYFLVFQASAGVSHGTAAKPTCDSKAVTRNCDYFRERSDQSVIKLPDGSTIDNPMFDWSKSTQGPNNTPLQAGGPMGGGYGYGSGLFTKGEYENFLSGQAGIIDALERTSLSTRFKMVYAGIAASMELNPNRSVRIPFPITDEKAKMQFVTPADLTALLKKEMSSKDFGHLQELIKIQKKPLQAQMEAQLQAQQKAMEAQKKQIEFQKVQTDIRNKKKDRIKELFLYSQEQVIATIRRGKRDSELTKEEKTLIAKVQSIELTDPDSPEVAGSPSCSGGVPNAFYLRESHTLNVCPNQVLKSDGDIIFAVTHEIGHSIDPCGARMPLWEVDQEKLKRVMVDASLSEEDKSTLKRIFPLKTKMSNSDLNLNFSNQKILDKLIQSGAIKKVQDGVGTAKYPFKKEYGCLVENEFFRETSVKDIATFKNYFKRDLKTNPDYKGLPQKSLDRYFTALDKYPQCLRTLALASQMKETMADMFGSVVAEKYILENPFKSEDEKVAAIHFAPSVCSSKSAELKVESYSPYTMADILRAAYEDPHPDGDERVKKVILNLPGMAKIYDCQRKVPACFDHLSFYKRMTSTSSGKSASGVKKEKGTK